MNSKLFRAGAWLANGNDNVVAATKLVVHGTKNGVLSFVAGYKAQRTANKVGRPMRNVEVIDYANLA